MSATAPPRRRLPNRALLDDLVLALLEHEDEAPSRWARVDELAAVLSWSSGLVRRESLYLEHCYRAVKMSPITGDFVRVVDLERYLLGDREVCHCGACGGAGESER